jgi:HSP20 family molecular chaperone IbpA
MAQELEKRGKREVGNTAVEQIVDAGTAFYPDVDIFANNEQLVVVADVPGVDKGDVQVEIDENQTLVIRARCKCPEMGRELFSQFNVGNYYRAFQLGKEYDQDGVAAQLENGVLVVTVPIREQARPRRIQVQV